MSDNVKIKLSDDEGLVLLEMLSRWFDEPNDALPDGLFSHPAERVVLEIIVAGQLEKQVAGPFAENFGGLLESARERLHTAYPSSLRGVSQSPA